MATSDDLLWQAASDFFEHASSSAGPAPGSSEALVGVEGAFDENSNSQPHHQAQLTAHQLAVAVAHHQQLVAAASHAANAAAPMHVGMFGEPQQALHVGSYGSTPGDGARVYLLPRSASLSALQQHPPQLVALPRGGSHTAPGELPMTLVPLMAGPQQGAVLPLTGHFAAVAPPQQHAHELLAAAAVAVPMHSSPPPGDSSSGGDADLDGWGEAPPAGGRSGSGGRGRARGAASAGGAASQSRSALAQKRFRERQKERMRSSMQRVEELSTQLEALMVERDRIQARSRLNERMLNLNLHHEARLHTDKARSGGMPRGGRAPCCCSGQACDCVSAACILCEHLQAAPIQKARALTLPFLTPHPPRRSWCASRTCCWRSWPRLSTWQRGWRRRTQQEPRGGARQPLVTGEAAVAGPGAGPQAA